MAGKDHLVFVRVVFVNDSVPHCFHGGGGVTAYSMVKALAGRGLDVNVVALASSQHNGNAREKDHIQHLKSELGVGVNILKPSEGPRGRRRWPTFKDQFPSVHQAGALSKRVDDLRPDVLLGYHWAALGAMYNVAGKLKLGIVGDPVHLPELFRREIFKRSKARKSVTRKIRERLLSGWNVKTQERGMVKLLNSCARSGAFAAHHAEDLQRWGAVNCQYFRTPTPDPNATSKRQGPKFKIMHIGHLKGVATIAGLEILADPVLPNLEKVLGHEGFEVHLVGGFFDELPSELRQKLIHAAVKIRGQINPPDEEFLTSHLLLVPTPIELGIRVRIITAFSFGACIVAHRANCKGIPELKDGYNCLLGNDGFELASACLRIYRDPELRRKLEAGSRETYDQFFSISVAGGRVAHVTEEIVGR